MALPPTPFTMLLAEAKTPTEIYAQLKRKRWLSSQALHSPETVIAFIATQQELLIERYNNQPICCGLGFTDELARALIISLHVNNKVVNKI